MRTVIPASSAIVVIRRERWRVEHAQAIGAIVRMDCARMGETGSAGATRTIDRPRRVTFLAPFDRVSIGVRRRLKRVRPQRAVRRLAELVAGVDRIDIPLAAVSAGIDLLPYQIEPTLAILAGARRLLLADDVGLGKTVQAGLVIAELQRRRGALHALVMAPASVRDQWAGELASRFGITSHIVDAHEISRLHETLGRHDNPWSRPGVCITSLDYLKQRHVLEGLPPRLWDLVVIDEAHGTVGDSDRHRAAHAVACRARHVLLLTATPDSGGLTNRDAFQHIGQVSDDGDSLHVFRRTRRDLGWPDTRRVRLVTVPITREEIVLLDALQIFERRALASAGTRHRDGTLLLLSVLRKRALSTAAALRSSILRRLEWLRARNTTPAWHQPWLDFESDTDVVSENDLSGLTATTGLDADDERQGLMRIVDLADAAINRGPGKVTRLLRLVSRTREPVIVFTEYRDSLDVLNGALSRVAPVAAMHGGLTPREQQQALGAFGQRARVLVATDVASQGLNLQQHARWVINFDLPWNPARLEQRAGRVDRLGQTRPVHVTLLTVAHPAEHALLTHIARRVLRARRALAEDDLFAGAFPTETNVRNAMLMAVPLAPGAPAPLLPRCRRWERAARVIAREFIRRRALIGKRAWGTRRVPPLVSGRPVAASLRRLAHLRPLSRGSLLVFTVPIVDGAGATLERHLVVLSVDSQTIATGGIEHAAVAAAAWLRRRAKRVAAALTSQGSIDGARERVLARHLRDALSSTAFQPGMFDHRAARAAEQGDAVVWAIDADLTARLAAVRQRSAVEIGPVRLEMVLD